ncbi:BTAD domain-containing putative transcriptional regulator [Phytohabitans sp. ZYX-F-186]|uniref:BTAD domain-containing putative transcriptional regulator n=1 Tax=Phytohabitans maris TaxID=3071409 RepID=A0ABU0ZG80_9ACTN|nr:BTAD domain-containing putative transcriptional regulator [Phytohabitans sp. ZYX-F-186]MDQ7906063.1 BTAD domain-containing putative transcriptional regulator [Phytohabitans sp. ZYX-F-186]
MTIRILGPLRLWRGDTELDPGPPQQAYLLALLLARAGQPVSAGDLIELIWGEDAPATALNVVQKYVGALRRLLEPDLRARETGSYLRRQGSGYLFVAGAGTLDLVAFRELAGAARAAAADQRREAALARYLEALELWRGAAGDGFANGPAAMAVFAGVNGEFFDSCVAAAELAMSLGRPERVLPPLRLAAAMAPLHEPVQACLVRVLGAVGRQVEAVAVFQTVRARLAEELGIDPGPALEAAHRQVLDQTGVPPAAGLVGRIEELGVLRQAVTPALAGGTGLVLVEGEPGVGKTRLLEEIAAEADRRGAFVVWGRCLEGDGTPSMWPWVQVVGALLDDLPAVARDSWLTGELSRLVEPLSGVPVRPTLPDRGAQFRMFERVVDIVGQTSARRPLVLVIDDLQWADVASLHLAGHVAARLPAGTAIVGALRDRAPTPGSELSRMLAAASRVPGHRRIQLGPLSQAEVATLVRHEIGEVLASGTVHSIHARTAGNPFFVRELARLLAHSGVLSEDAARRAGVPSTVRDVVRDRMADLDDRSQGLLQVAAIIGRDVDLGLLARAAGLDGDAILDRLEPLQALGLLGPVPGDPYSVRFAHDLVRESVAESTSRSQATRLHLRVANALESDPSDGESVAESLAHHLWAAGPLADPARTTQALVRAARRAANMAAFEAANRQLESAVHLARSAGLAALELSALSLLAIVIRRHAQYRGSSFDVLERAEHLARRLGRDAQAADFLYTRWIAAAHAAKAERDQLAHRLRAQGDESADPVVRAYGRQAWGLYQWEAGNIGEAFRYMDGNDRTTSDASSRPDEDEHRRDVQFPWPYLHAMVTTLHVGAEAGRALLDTLEAAAGDDPYAISVWAYYTGIVASMVGEPAWGQRAVKRWLAADPEHFFVHVDPYLRQTRCWTRALTGDDPAGAAAEAEQLLTTTLLDPPRWGVAFYCGLIGEMLLAAGKPAEASAALDRADRFLDSHGQRYAEGLLLLLRAQVLHAGGEPVTAVRAAAERARQLSVEREAHLFAHRAERFLAEF